MSAGLLPAEPLDSRAGEEGDLGDVVAGLRWQEAQRVARTAMEAATHVTRRQRDRAGCIHGVPSAEEGSLLAMMMVEWGANRRDEGCSLIFMIWGMMVNFSSNSSGIG